MSLYHEVTTYEITEPLSLPNYLDHVCYLRYDESPESADPAELSRRRAELMQQFAELLSTAENDIQDAVPEELPPSVGLLQLHEALCAQRQEMKLFTKSARQTQELLQYNIEETSKAVESFERFQKERPEIERKAVMTFLASLMEIDESLQRADDAAKTLQNKLIDLVQGRIDTAVESYCDMLSPWERFWHRKTLLHYAGHLAKAQISGVSLVLDPFLVGLEMLVQRMNDVLKKHAIIRLNPVGQPVDPETMQVVGTVHRADIPRGYVVEVVRFGYTHQNVVLRFADVRANQ